MSEWHVYIVRCADSTLYTGITKDIESRLARHNAGQGAKYTRGRLPVCLIYQEVAENRGAALRRELEIKRLPLAEKQQLAAQSLPLIETG